MRTFSGLSKKLVEDSYFGTSREVLDKTTDRHVTDSL